MLYCCILSLYAETQGKCVILHMKSPFGVSRQHLRGHPPLERLRLRQLRREHQRVESAFVDEDSLLASSDGVANRDGILVFVIDMFSQRVTGIAVPQRLCHVFAHEERLASITASFIPLYSRI